MISISKRDNDMSKDWSDFERYLIQRIDKLEDKLTDVRLKVAGMAVVISLATSAITATIVADTKARAAQPAIVEQRNVKE